VIAGTLTGQIEILTKDIKELEESFGEGFIAASDMKTGLGGLNDTLSDPAFKEGIKSIGELFGKMAQGIGLVIANITQFLSEGDKIKDRVANYKLVFDRWSKALIDAGFNSDFLKQKMNDLGQAGDNEVDKLMRVIDYFRKHKNEHPGYAKMLDEAIKLHRDGNEALRKQNETLGKVIDTKVKHKDSIKGEISIGKELNETIKKENEELEKNLKLMIAIEGHESSDIRTKAQMNAELKAMAPNLESFNEKLFEEIKNMDGVIDNSNKLNTGNKDLKDSYTELKAKTELWLQVGNAVCDTLVKIADLSEDAAKAIDSFAQMATSAISGDLAGAIAGTISFITSSITSLKDTITPYFKDMWKQAEEANSEGIQKIIDDLQKSWGWMSKITGDASPFAQFIKQLEKLKEEKGLEEETKKLFDTTLNYYQNLKQWTLDGATGYKQMKDAIKDNVDLTAIFGDISTQVYDEVLNSQKFLAENPALTTAIAGYNSAFQNLYNMANLNSTTYEKMKVDLEEYGGKAKTIYDELISKGADQKTALEQIAPSLKILKDMAEEYGYVLDDDTKALIDQADKAGLLETEAEIFRDIRDILKAIAKVLKVDFPDATDTAIDSVGDLKLEIDKIGPIDPPWKDWGKPPDPNDYDYNYDSGSKPPNQYAALGMNAILNQDTTIRAHKGEHVLITPRSERGDGVKGANISTSFDNTINLHGVNVNDSEAITAAVVKGLKYGQAEFEKVLIQRLEQTFYKKS